jgi:phosphoribosylformylglycinamidine synthase subunit PurSL
VLRIEIALKDGVADARGRAVAEKAAAMLGIVLANCRTRDVYKVSAELDDDAARRVAAAFADPVAAVAAIDRLPPPQDFDWMVAIGFKPGVTDNVGRTARCILQDLLERELAWEEQVYTEIQYFISGQLARGDIERLGRDLLANSLIQTITVYSQSEWMGSVIDRSLPLFTDASPTEVKTIALPEDDEGLMRISSEGILSLSLDEMRAIRAHYLQPSVRAHRAELGLPEWPTDIELECIAQTWSEHCSHKIFSGRIDYHDLETGERETINSLYRSYVKASTRKIAERIDWLVSVFTDNAGVIRFSNDLNLVYKVETHNSPSALDPYGGAMTGIVGVNRDPMGTGMGSALLSNVWGYCLGSPFYQGAVPEGLMHPRRIRDGVHEGVIDGGNQSGIPYSRGFECFDERYLGKPLVYCGTLGSIPASVGGRPSERKEVEVGDFAVMLGGRIGKDGIHGATFSSEELRTESPAQAVQIGDPLTQRNMYEFLLEARDLGLYRCITDNGAGGISCSFGEMGKYSGGCDCELADAPLKYAGLQPWEILVSEAQERMTLAVPPEKRAEFEELARRRDVEACFMGRFDDSGYFTVKYEGKVIMSLAMDFLYESGCPILAMPARWKMPCIPGPQLPEAPDRATEILRLLGDLNICSREYKSRMYDGEVKGLSVVKPYVGVGADVPSDATVMRVEYDSDRGAVLAEAINPWFSDLDTYHMTASVIDEAVRRVVAVGARLDRIAILDNFCWPDPVESPKTPDGAYKLAQLVRANKALYDYSVAYGVPAISGKDSCKNDSTRGGRKISIPPTLLISSLGQIDDVRQSVTAPFKCAEDCIYVVGQTREELGASAYYRMLAAEQGEWRNYGGEVPKVDADAALRIYAAMNEATAAGLLRSATSPSKGGLAVALALATVGSGLGAKIDLAAIPVAGELDDAARLFSESNSRFVISCRAEDAPRLEQIFDGLPLARVGAVVASGGLRITSDIAAPIAELSIDDMRREFKSTLQGV